MPPGLDALTLPLAQRLLIASVQGGLVIAVVWLVCRRLPALRPSTAAVLWWLASLKLLMALLPVPSLSIPLLPSKAPAVASLPRDSAVVALLESTTTPAGALANAVLPADVERPAVIWTRWIAVAVGLWLVALLAQAGRLLIAFGALRGIIRRSRPLEEDPAAITRLASVVGLRFTPEVRVSDEIDSAQVAGVRRPIVLLPAELAIRLSDADRLMAICHELVHVRRHDLAFGWVPAVAERLFFFHPLARLAAREYVVAREAACDAAVVRALDVGPGEYGRLLVRLGVGGSNAVFTARGSSPSITSLKRRLDMLHHLTSTRTSRHVTWSVALLVVVALVPMKLGARSPSQAAAPAAVAAEPLPALAPAPPVPPAPVASPAPPAPVAPVRRPANAVAPPAAPARRPVNQAAPAPMPAVPAPAPIPPRPVRVRPSTSAAAVEPATPAQDTTEDVRRRLEDVQIAAQLQQLQRQLDLLTRQLATRKEPDPGKLATGAQQKELAKLVDAQQKIAEARRKQAETLLKSVDERKNRTTDNQRIQDAQRLLIEQQQELARQQEQLAAQQRALSAEAERIRALLERAAAAQADPQN